MHFLRIDLAQANEAAILVTMNFKCVTVDLWLGESGANLFSKEIPSLSISKYRMPFLNQSIIRSIATVMQMTPENAVIPHLTQCRLRARAGNFPPPYLVWNRRTWIAAISSSGAA
jgi:hypothetical protein